MSDSPPIDAAAVIADLRELDRLTGGQGGARRLCWGPEWREARAWLRGRLEDAGVAPELDEAGNLWAYLEGRSEPALALGSHLDSVPGGGWLDGALGVIAALGVVRAWAGAGAAPPRTIALVDWADEEGARFGRSLFGSSAVAGTLDPEEMLDLVDADGRRPEDVLAENSVALGAIRRAEARRERLAALLELHIEQGPILEAERVAAAAVDGTVGVERWRFRLRGQTSHAGTTPMDARRDAGLAVAATALAIERLAVEHGGVATSGGMAVRPGIATAVPGEAELLVDLRHPVGPELRAMLAEARSAAGEAALERGCELSEVRIWRIDPIRFDPGLVAAARGACAEVAGSDRVITSGALHDAAELARHLPVAMVFCASVGGISHAPEEDSREADLVRAIEAFGLLADRALRALAD
jgi:hydantoinase/carbamoylase family amidase